MCLSLVNVSVNVSVSVTVIVNVSVSVNVSMSVNVSVHVCVCSKTTSSTQVSSRQCSSIIMGDHYKPVWMHHIESIVSIFLFYLL